MSTSYPARIPASAFTNPRRRKPSLKNFSPIPPLKPPRSAYSNVDDIYIPRPPTFMSIAYLRDAISAIEVKMTALAKERTELETKLETAVRLQSPILRLPSELLSSIFTIGVLGMGEEDPIMVPTLMLVCRYWAEVALNTPILWAKISISPHDSLDKARRRLMRSKSCPLDITVNFGPRIDYVQSITEQITHAMDLFRPALWRTKSFSLTVPNRPQAYTALLHCQEDAPMLESLTIQVYHSMQEDRYSNPPLIVFNGCTPNLRSCSLTSFNFGWDLKLMTGLRVLKLGGYFNSSTPSASTLIGILRQCPELEEVSLRNMSDVDSNPCSPAVPHDPDVPIANRIHLPRLKKMSFYYAGITHTQKIMAQISFPNLESLELAYLENVSPLLQLLYAQALTRLPLKFLRIETCLFNEVQFVNLLRKLHSLVTLQLVDIEHISYHSLNALSSSQPWACPRLEYVMLDGCTSVDWDSLRAFVESRLPADPHAYKRYHSSVASIMSSASVAAAQHARLKSRQDRSGHAALVTRPQRIRMIDVTRCNQIGREMVQWLRMYVASVKCEPAKGVWGEPMVLS
ncbi:hypothetical protein M413DRAFT_397075 [Hebeloma cylindrosporum]|uniref:F-box domain-containing protein n=1 Tax=Hebeloma cylindrosporum TaxID=76867 RepID=A0A0C3CHT8_HEBCY|nr:hypothetical protein M413DRAFT_397075 [Hebeloma cylindrosporum h7]